MKTTVEIKNNKVYLQGEYTPELPAKAKRIGGRWNPSEKAWTFDPKDIERVKRLAKKVYGWEEETGEKMDVQIRISNEDKPDAIMAYDFDNFKGCTESEWRIAGRLLASRKTKFSEVKLEENVVLVDGDFADRGGSASHPSIYDINVQQDLNVVLEVRECTPGFVKALPKGTYTIVSKELDREALRVEKARLMARIAEINALLGE